MPKRKTHEEFEREIENIYPNIKPITKYNNAKTIITFICTECNNIFNISPESLARNYKNKKYEPCPYCSGRKLNTNDFTQRLFDKCNNNITLLSEYTGMHNLVDCKCNLCGYVWSENAKTVLERKFCPKCRKKSLNKPKELVLNELLSKNKDVFVELDEKYINTTSRISCTCKICGFNWYPTAIGYKTSDGNCPKCIHHTKLTNSEFLKRLEDENRNIEVLGEFKSVNEKIACKCKICGHIWNTEPRNIISNRKNGCPKCKNSKGEKKIENWLINNNIYYISQKTFQDLIGLKGGKLSYDFYLPNENILIEYQGQQHEKPVSFYNKLSEENAIIAFGNQQEHDRRKREYAEKYNIKLLEIWYWDFKNIEEILSKELNLLIA